MLATSTDVVVVGAAASKLSDLVTRVAALAGQHRDSGQADIRSQADIPGWGDLDSHQREEVEGAIETLDRLLGDRWH
jgi:hypothetical protein